MNILAELGCGAAEIENVGVKAATVINSALRQLDQPPGLRHLARTGVLRTRRAVDQQDARELDGIVVAQLRVRNRVARGEPIDREIVSRIGEPRTGLARVRRLAA